MDDQEKKLKMMRFWLFGTFLIIFVAAVIYIGGVWNFWYFFGAITALCVVTYFLLKKTFGGKE